MTNAVNADSQQSPDSHRVLSSNGGDARLYAEQLLVRICRKWGVPLHEVKGDRRTSRRRGDNMMRQAVLAEFFVGIEDQCCGNGQTAKHTGQLSSLEIAAVIAISRRQVQNRLRVVRLYGSRRVSEVKKMTGYDRAAFEELVAGGGQ